MAVAAFGILLVLAGIALANGSGARSPGDGSSAPQHRVEAAAVASRRIPSAPDPRNLVSRARIDAAAAATVRDTAYPASATIGNGTIQLGVNPTGELNVPGGTPSSGTGTTEVGLRYVPTNADAVGPGCACEGWGVADAPADGITDANAGTTGYANRSTDHGKHHLRVVEFSATADSAHSVVDVLGGPDGETSIMRVTHDYVPSAASPNLYEVDVSVENLTGTPIGDLRYRRVMDWDVEPTAFDEFVTIDGDRSAKNLVYSSDDGFQTANPLGPQSKIDVDGFFTDNGPDDHGALFDFSFGAVGALETQSFKIYYGAAGSEADATTAISAVQAEVWSFGQPDTADGPALGTPNTFVFAFGGIGGAGAVSDERPPVTLSTQAPNRLAIGENELDVNAQLVNTGDTDIAGGRVRIDPGSGLTLVSGSNPTPVGTLPAHPSDPPQTATWHLRAPAPDCHVSHTYEYDVYGDFDGSAGNGGERHVHRSVTVPRICGQISGIVTFENATADDVEIEPIANATVFACPKAGTAACASATTDAAGSYKLDDLPAGVYSLEARPGDDPRAKDLPPITQELTLEKGGALSQSFQFGNLAKPPADGSSTVTAPGAGTTDDGYPLVNWSETMHLVTHVTACAHPTVTYALTQGDPVVVTLAHGTMVEGPAGTFSADVPPVFPSHGYSQVTFTAACADPDDDPAPVSFSIYIDPSGRVHDVDGSPVSGAQVTLLTAASAGGPFTPVPGGSAVMSPSNRTNPDTTTAGGDFGWDVAPGFYVVRAQKDGCHSAADPGVAYAQTAVLHVPPPVTGLDLKLDCRPASEGTGPAAPSGGNARPPAGGSAAPSSTTTGPRAAGLKLTKFGFKKGKLTIKGEVAVGARLRLTLVFHPRHRHRTKTFQRTIKPDSQGNFKLTIRLPRGAKPVSLTLTSPKTSTLLADRVTHRFRR